jgi:GNAT superfamily N-acetyltransferase
MDMEAEIIRPAPDDPLLAAVVCRFRDVPAERAAEAARAFTMTPNTVAFVAAGEGEPLGWCWGHLLPRPDGLVTGRLDDLMVAEEHRGKGLGRALLRAFMDEVARQGAVKMSLTTGADNAPARALYESLGGGLASQGPTVNYWFLLNR